MVSLFFLYRNSNSTTVNLTGGGTKTVTIGDTFTLSYNGVKHGVRLLGFKHDTLAEDTSYGEKETPAGMSFEFTRFLGSDALKLHSSQNASIGWKDYDLRISLNGSSDDEKGGIVAELSNSEYIKKVVKPYLKGNTATVASEDCSDWL